MVVERAVSICEITRCESWTARGSSISGFACGGAASAAARVAVSFDALAFAVEAMRFPQRPQNEFSSGLRVPQFQQCIQDSFPDLDGQLSLSFA
jgi:hypothetical protein